MARKSRAVLGRMEVLHGNGARYVIMQEWTRGKLHMVCVQVEGVETWAHIPTGKTAKEVFDMIADANGWVDIREVV